MQSIDRLVTTFVLFTVLTNELVQAQPATLADLPAGSYRYEATHVSSGAEPSQLLLWKRGHTVIGVQSRSATAKFCFRGFVEQNRIVNATRVAPPYAPDSRWEALRGDAFNLDDYRRSERALTEGDQAALRQCFQVFWR